jgi:hypothetical protein
MLVVARWDGSTGFRDRSLVIAGKIHRVRYDKKWAYDFYKRYFFTSDIRGGVMPGGSWRMRVLRCGCVRI